MKIRPFIISDTPSVVKVYRDAVQRIGPIAYTPEQIAAWSRYPTDELDFGQRLARGLTLVMEESGIIYAFGQLRPRNCFAFLYTRGDTHKKGLGTLLYEALEDHAFSNGLIDMHTEVSRIARPFFEKRGFTLDEIVRNTHFGVEFEWYRLKRSREAARAYRLARLQSGSALVTCSSKNEHPPAQEVLSRTRPQPTVTLSPAASAPPTPRPASSRRRHSGRAVRKPTAKLSLT